MNQRIDKDIVVKYVEHRKKEIYKKIVSPRLDEDSTDILRGRFAELVTLLKALEVNLAIPEGRND